MGKTLFQYLMILCLTLVIGSAVHAFQLSRPYSAGFYIAMTYWGFLLFKSIYDEA